MAKSSNQKVRLLIMRDILLRETDEDHKMTIPRFLQHLAASGIEVERKSLYDDIEALRDSGMDIQLVRGRSGGYFVGERDFELPELKLLVDAVQSSRFITAQKSSKLIRKLETLTNKHQARQLQRQVEVNGRIKNMNESIYYVVDAIHEAILQDRKISFRYSEWTVDPSSPGGFACRDKHNGAHYEVSPWALVWMEENYYLIAYDEAADRIKHYRVDKMHNQRILSAERAGKETFENFDLPGYTRSLFGMFSGTPVEVELAMVNEKVGVLVDRFGRDLVLHPGPREGWFTVRLKVVPGPTFYGWVMSFGSEAEVLSPAQVRESVAAQAKTIGELYR